MTPAVLEDGSPSSLSSEPRRLTSPPPQAESSTTAVGGKDGAAGQQQADTGIHSSALEEQQQHQSDKKRPWWKTRRAKLAYAVGALLLVALVVLLTLGLLGYFKKVGPFANLFEKQAAQSPANPLSTIPLMADPFATQPAAPTSTPTVLALAGVPTPTNQPIFQAVRYCSSPGFLFNCPLHRKEVMIAFVRT